MHWLAHAAGHAAPTGGDAALDLWWWPEDRQPPAASRRARTDVVLRAVLAPYVGLPAEALAFGREAKGRPFLRHPGAPDFNLSDTVGGSLVGVWRGGRVGIDLERRQRHPPVARLARRWYTAAEAQALAALDDEAARQAFLALWTAKEAACKATGTGIFGRLDRWRFAVGVEPPQVLALPEEAGAASEWHFLRLAPGDEHTAVAACRGRPPEPRGFIVIAD